MIVNIRGTHGSGKSTIVRELMARYNAAPILHGGTRRPRAYALKVPLFSHLLYVVGPYETACGGCDAIQPYADIWPIVEKVAAWGHVLFEGALVSSSYGNIGRASELYGDEFVFAFLDTPLRVCLERIAARRRARGDDRPVDPRNTETKYNNIVRSRGKIEAAGRNVVTLDHRRAVLQVTGIFKHGTARHVRVRQGPGDDERPGPGVRTAPRGGPGA